MSNDGFETLFIGQIKSLIKELDKEFNGHIPDKWLLVEESLHSSIEYARRKE